MTDYLEIWRRNPQTGELTERAADRQTIQGICTLLCNWTGYDSVKLDRLAVTGVGKRGASLTGALNAEVWLEEHPIEAVLAAWTAGSRASADARQHSLHALWPALAKGLDNLEVNNPNDGAVTKVGPDA